jgi:hypothetical protein
MLQFPRRSQPVEKVVIGPVVVSKQDQKHLQNTTKPGCSGLEQGSEKGTKEFFNRLISSWQAANRGNP